MRKEKQFQLIKKEKSDYGGTLYRTQANRQKPRPLATRKTMHLVLRSSQAVGRLSFHRFEKPIKNILNKFADKYHIKILAYANVGNHLHLHIKLHNRQSYARFIRAISSAIMMKVTGTNRWSKNSKLKSKFWDLRPFTRILSSYTERLKLKDYIQINQYQGLGYSKFQARFIHNLLKPNTS